MSKLKIGLALGSGSSRGWSHIGIINALTKHGIEPDIISGTSIGALVGASYASNNLSKLEHWVRSLTKMELALLFDINSSFNGFVNTEKLHHLMSDYVANSQVEINELSKKYASVATDLETGREIWLDEGPILEAVWASMSLPGLFPAIRKNDKWLVDGGLVNPVPVSVCRALGADTVIAVNLNGDIVGKHLKSPVIPTPAPKKEPDMVDRITQAIEGYTASLFSTKQDKAHSPSLFETIASSVNITQDRITKSRMVGDPPDVLLTPQLSHISLLEFYRADESIREGEQVVERMLPEIQRVLELS